MIRFEGWYVFRDWSAGLRQMYWRLRNCRRYDAAARRKWYRRIKGERERLHALGFDAEYTRLFCRYMSDPKNEAAAIRLICFEGMLDVLAGVSSSSAMYFKRVQCLKTLSQDERRSVTCD